MQTQQRAAAATKSPQEHAGASDAGKADDVRVKTIWLCSLISGKQATESANSFSVDSHAFQSG